MATSNSTQSVSPSQPKLIKRIVMITASCTSEHVVVYATQQRAEVRCGDRSALAAWTDRSMQAAAVALHEELEQPAEVEIIEAVEEAAVVAALRPTCTEQAQEHIVKLSGIDTGNPRDSWRALFDRWVDGRKGVGNG